jgi:uncharacterized protein
VWVYCDTSALAKRYVREPGRAELMKLLKGRRVVSSVLLPVELHSAFCRRERAGAIAAASVPKLFQRVALDQQYWTLVETSSAVLESAQRLVEEFPLRTLDAVHVASARIFVQRAGVALTFVTSDARQRDAACRLGFDVRMITG